MGKLVKLWILLILEISKMKAHPFYLFSAPLRPARLLLDALMLVGRLEIAAVLLMFAPVAAKLRGG